MTTTTDPPTVVLYRPTGPKELALVKALIYEAWPARLPEQPIFYPITNEAYACQIAAEWNVPESGSGFVTRFHVRKPFMDRFPQKQVGAQRHTEWWIPAEDLAEMNQNMVGPIEIIAEYHQATHRRSS